jgi:Transglutaminase-like superfamily
MKDNNSSRVLVLKSILGLSLFDLLGFGSNFPRLHRYIKDWAVMRRSPQSDTLERVCDAVNYACVCYPKRVLCLQRSVVTTCLLRSCGLPAKVVIGVQPVPFKAHAWTELDGKPVNERTDVHKGYSVTERF